MVEYPNKIKLNTYELTTCPEGFVHSVSTDFPDFVFNRDGSIGIPKLGIWRPNGQFCVDEFDTLDPIRNPYGLAVRFCCSDPCWRKKCIRKCCPDGMTLYVDSVNSIVYCRLDDDAHGQPSLYHRQ